LVALLEIKSSSEAGPLGQNLGFSQVRKERFGAVRQVNPGVAWLAGGSASLHESKGIREPVDNRLSF
jgi:hypothetical protein